MYDNPDLCRELLELMLKEQYQAGEEAEREKTIAAKQRAEEERRRAEEAERKLKLYIEQFGEIKDKN